MQTLADYSVKNSKAAIDIDYFPKTAASFYWSSTTNGKSVNGAWGINFSYGFDIYVMKTDSGNIRAVRGGQSVPMGNLSVTPSSLSVTKDSGTAAFSISNTGAGAMSWTAVVTSGGSWLRITSGIGGTAAGTISIAYDANTGSGSRTGTIRITASNATESPKEITIIQSGTSSQFLGAWSDAVYSWNAATNKWVKIPSTAGALMIAAGKVDNDAVDDLIGVWSSGLYVRQSTNGQWLKLTAAPTWITVGDLNNDGRDDLIGIWSNSVYVRYGATGKWQLISTSKPRWITTGKLAETAQAADSPDDSPISDDGERNGAKIVD